MQQARQSSTATIFQQQATADICDAYPAAQIIQSQFLSFGGNGKCVGPVEIVATQDDNSLVKTALSEAGEGRVLFVDNSASINCAMLGGDLAALAADNGWAGIVINGAVRDADELTATPIAVFALATCPRKSKKRGLGTIGQPVRVGGTYIRRHDLIAADSDGVVFLASWAAKG